MSMETAFQFMNSKKKYVEKQKLIQEELLDLQIQGYGTSFLNKSLISTENSIWKTVCNNNNFQLSLFCKF